MAKPGFYTTEKASTEYIYVNHCGMQVIEGRDTNTLRPDGRIDFGIQYVVSGTGYYEDDGETRSIGAGSLILHFPGVRQHYFMKGDAPTTLMWSHFTGLACQMLEPLKSNRTVNIKISNPKDFELTLKKMIYAQNARGQYYESTCGGYMIVLMSMILESSIAQARIKQGTGHDRLEDVINHMNVYYQQPIDLDKYADMCYVSRSRFLHIFKEYTGVSPYHYQLKIRIDRAVEILTYTSMNINECAAAVGFKDTSYFCRIFKKYTSKTPSYYKK